MGSQAGNRQSSMALLKKVAAQERSRAKKHHMIISAPNPAKTGLPPANKLLKTTALHFPTLIPRTVPMVCQGTWPCLLSLDHCPFIISLASNRNKIPWEEKKKKIKKKLTPRERLKECSLFSGEPEAWGGSHHSILVIKWDLPKGLRFS